MKDWRKTDMHVGSRVVYPIKEGSSPVMKEGVIEVCEMHYTRYRGYNMNLPVEIRYKNSNICWRIASSPYIGIRPQVMSSRGPRKAYSTAHGASALDEVTKRRVYPTPWNVTVVEDYE